MRALGVYESMFGNTEAVARAVADGLAEMHDVDCEVSKCRAVIRGLDRVGGPSMRSRWLSATRASAREQGGRKETMSWHRE